MALSQLTCRILSNKPKRIMPKVRQGYGFCIEKMNELCRLGSSCVSASNFRGRRAFGGISIVDSEFTRKLQSNLDVTI